MKLPKPLLGDHALFTKVSRHPLDISPNKRYFYSDYVDLKLAHLYTVEVYSSLLTGISQERRDYSNLLYSLGHDLHLQIAEIISQKPPSSRQRQSLFKKSSSHAEESTKINQKILRKLHSNATPSSPQPAEEPVKPIIRIEFIPNCFHLGLLLRSYRTCPLVEAPTNSLFWSILPSWMYPVYYWGRNEKFTLTKRLSSVGGDEKVIALEEFEDKLTNWASHVVTKLKERVNRRLYKQKHELEKELLSIHQLHMEYEDHRSALLRIHEKQIEAERMEQKQQQLQPWYTKYLQCFHRNKKITSFPPGSSPDEYLKIYEILKKIRLPRSMVYGDMSVLYRHYLGDYGVKGFRERHHQGHNKPAEALAKSSSPKKEHIYWVSRLDWNDDERSSTPSAKRSYHHGYVPKRALQLLGEMLVGGGIRSIVCVARAIMDLEKYPGGSSLCEPVPLYTMLDDPERMNYLKSCRLGFQDRELCHAT